MSEMIRSCTKVCLWFQNRIFSRAPSSISNHSSSTKQLPKLNTYSSTSRCFNKTCNTS